jgi:hypothetical protein
VARSRRKICESADTADFLENRNDSLASAIELIVDFYVQLAIGMLCRFCSTIDKSSSPSPKRRRLRCRKGAAGYQGRH